MSILSVTNPDTQSWGRHATVFFGTGQDTLSFANMGDPSAPFNYTMLSVDSVSVDVVPEPNCFGFILPGAGFVAMSRKRAL